MSRVSGRKKRQRVRTILMLAAVIVTAGTGGMLYLKQKVTKTYAEDNSGTAESEKVEKGSITTSVTGTGTLSPEGTEDITVPKDVTVSSVQVSEGSSVQKGDLLFSVDSASVLSAMKDIQSQIDTLDASLEEASSDAVSSSLTSGVSGRVKQICVEAGDDVATVMSEEDALLVLSLDGYMSVDVDTELLKAGDEVTVTTSDGTAYTGTVDSSENGHATILITDDGPVPGDAVTVTFESSVTSAADTGESEQETQAEAAGQTEAGTEAAAADTSSETDAAQTTEVSLSGTLAIHSPLSVTGYAGTVSSVDVSENESVDADTSLLTLTDTSYSANYDSILEQRTDLEDTLGELIKLYRAGGVYAEFSGVVDTVSEDYTDLIAETDSTGSTAAASSDSTGSTAAASSDSTGSTAAASSDSTGSTAAASSGSTGSTSAASSGSTAETGTTSDTESTVLTLDPNKEMVVSVSVDETDILSLKTGQAAVVTVDSISGETFDGTVTDIDTSGSSDSGVTSYTAQVTIEKTSQMLSGMSADVSITIDSVENALLVPSDAVHETRSAAYVYTTYDEKTNEYGGMTEVVTGMTDGDKTEITSGLKEGDTVYYEEESTSQQEGMMGMGAGMTGMGGSGNMPSFPGGSDSSGGGQGGPGSSGNSQGGQRSQGGGS